MMANRRMFSKSITGSARFMRMPTSARLLYYDLGMNADDDGIVEAFPVMRMTGANDDDLKVLSAKNFVQVLNEDLVTFITDWHLNNHVRKDRYVPSIYREMIPTTNGKPSDNQIQKNVIPVVDQIAENVIPVVNQRSTQYRIGKDRIDQYSIDDGGEQVPPPEHINGYVSSYIELSPTAMEELTSFRNDGISDDIIRYAVDQAIDNRIRKWSYVRAILQKCIDMGLKTIAEVRNAEAERKKQIEEKKKPQAVSGYQTHERTQEDFPDSFFLNFQ